MDNQQDLFGMDSTETTPFPEQTVAPEAGEARAGEPSVPETPAEIDYRLEYEKLQQKLGSDADVNVVKSQRDQLRHQFEQMQAQIDAERQQVQQAMAQAQAQLQYYQQQQLQQMPPEQQQAYFAQAQQMQYQQQMQAYQQRAEEAQQALLRYQAQEQAESVKQAIIRPYVDAAKSVGLSERDLDLTSFETLTKSYNEKVLPMLGMQRPPSPPAVPNRGTPLGPQSPMDWMRGIINQENGMHQLEGVFDQLERGVDPRDLIHRS